MGRAFEFRKERKMKRWGHMAKTFTKLGKEITIAVKQGGAEVTGNPRLRALIAEAKSEQMPKENIERAIKKATEAKTGDFKEIVYEGFGPFGIAYLVEAATDNNTRTVANVRSYFTKCGGSLQTSGSVAFMFDHKCVFRIKEDPAKPTCTWKFPFTETTPLTAKSRNTSRKKAMSWFPAASNKSPTLT